MFDPNEGEGVESKLIAKGEYLCKITDLKRDSFPSGTEYLFLFCEIVSNYDDSEECSRGIGKSFKIRFFFTDNGTKFYRQFCRDLGVGAHDVDNDYDVGDGEGLRDIWIGRFAVGNLTGKRDDGGYPDYNLWNPRAATAKEYESFGGLSKDEIPF